jgi:hypothetical protein
VPVVEIHTARRDRSATINGHIVGFATVTDASDWLELADVFVDPSSCAGASVERSSAMSLNKPGDGG